MESGSKIGDGYGAVGAEELPVDDVEAVDSALHHIAEHHITQVERVIHDGLGDVTRLIFHHLLVVDPHLVLDGLRLKGFLKVVVGRGVDERRDVLKHKIQGVDGHLGLHLVKHIANVMGRRILLVEQVDEFISSFGKDVGGDRLVGRGHLKVNLVLELD